MSNLLSIENINISYQRRYDEIHAVRNVSLQLGHGERLGLVGESGCGKSTLAFAILNWISKNSTVNGRILFNDRDILTMPEAELRKIRGSKISMIYQNPAGSLNPVTVIGKQLIETVQSHENVSYQDAYQRSLAMLEEVMMPDPAAVMQRYPHEMSGGQIQRVVICMALLTKPDLLILDEPTTGLDVTIEALIMDLLEVLAERHGMAIIMISHNTGIVNRLCERVGVMYSGEIVEEGSTKEVFTNPLHPYTRGLLDSLPSLEHSHHSWQLKPIDTLRESVKTIPNGCAYTQRCSEYKSGLCNQQAMQLKQASPAHHVKCIRHEKLDHWLPPQAVKNIDELQPMAQSTDYALEIKSLSKNYRQSVGTIFAKSRRAHAVNNLSTKIVRSQTTAIVGESGCGKSTLAKIITGLTKASNGKLMLFGQNVAQLPSSKRPNKLKEAVQIIFQHPDLNLNPSHTIGYAIARSLKSFGHKPKNLSKQIGHLLDKVQLPAGTDKALPRQLSGGQKQRVAIARAIANSPQIIVADEPVSALDVSVQASIINLFLKLKEEQQATTLFISHDLAVVRYLADNVLVLYRGSVVEGGPSEQVFAPPYHPYTKKLLSSVSNIYSKTPRLPTKAMATPTTSQLPTGCPYFTACDKAVEGLCDKTPPSQHKLNQGHIIACHLEIAELEEAV